MNSKLRAKKLELHRKLYKNMKDNIEEEDFQDLKRLCKDQYLRPGVVQSIRNVTDLLDTLEKKGKIGVEIGYQILKDLLTESGLESDGLVTDIIETEDKMRELEAEYGDVFEEPKNNAPRRSIFQVDTYRRRLSDPGVSIEVKRQRLSRTESDAEVEYTYPINPENKSFLLIIDQFTQQREGSEVDRSALDNLFRDVLGFEVIIYENLNKQNFTNKLSETADYIRQSLFQFDRLFVAILSHGDENGIKTCLDPMTEEPGKYMTVEDIIKPFKSVELPKMAGKPKVFLMQACRGARAMDGVQVDGDVGCAKQPTQRLVTDLGGRMSHPNDADFLICNASTESHVSYRDTERGSWFIQTLVKVFRDQYSKEHVLDMMTEVNRRVSALEAHTPEGEKSDPLKSGPKKQSPCQISTLTKKIILGNANL